jgi:hypothetical protein
MRVTPQVRRWLTGPGSDPSVRVRFYTEVEGRSPSDPKVRTATQAIGKEGWAAQLLERQMPDGHWATPGSTGPELYTPKYIATNWVAIVLSDLGMTRSDPRIATTAELVLDRWRGDLAGPEAEICVTGNAVRYLTRFGYLDHPRVQEGIDWMVTTQKSDGGWHCFPSRTGTLDSWEGLAAFAEIPESARDKKLRRSIERGAEFFLERRLKREGSGRYDPWFRIHYPNHYYYDLLVGLKILTRLGYAADRRLTPALDWLRRKRARDGRWSLDALLPDPPWPDDPHRRVHYPMILESPGLPSRWATVEALSVLARPRTD